MNEQPLTLASLGARLGAALIDGVLAMAIIVPIMLVAGILQQALSGVAMTFEQQAIFFVVGWAVFLIFHGYLLYTRGQTIGKMIVKTKIVDLQGNLPKFGNLLLMRYFILSLVTQIPLLGNLAGIVDILFIFGKERRCLHDYLAGTRVVNA